MLVLLPCYSLEDFSLYRGEEEANEIFAAWSALYHPQLLEIAGCIPEWEPAGSPNVARQYHLIIIPSCCESLIPVDSLKTIEDSGTLLVRNCHTRNEMIQEAFRLIAARIDSLPAPENTESTDSEPLNADYAWPVGYQSIPSIFEQDTVDSFLAAGLAYFISDLLTRKLRYMSDIDTTELEKRMYVAINGFREGNHEAGEDGLQKTFDLICQATEYYFPTPAKFLDLTWFEEGDTGEPLAAMLLRRRLRGEKSNLFLSDSALSELETQTESLKLVRDEIQNGRVETIMGFDIPAPWLLSQSELLSTIEQHATRFESVLGQRPIIFGRYEAGYCPAMPQLLKQCGFKAALLFCKDGWTTDFKNQSRINWKGLDGTIIPSLAKKPINGENGAAFMELLDELGYSWNNDDVMTAVFAHRPNRETQWPSEVARFNRYDPILGESLGMKEYFELTETVGPVKLLERDDFRTNYLTRAAKADTPNPVSHWSLHYIDRQHEMTEHTASAMDRVFSLPHNKRPSGPQGMLLVNPAMSPRYIILDGRPEKPDEETEKHVLLTTPVPNGYQTLVKLPSASQFWLKMDTTSRPDSSELLPPPSRKGFLRRIIDSLTATEPVSTEPPKMVRLVENRYSATEVERYYSVQNDLFELQIDPVTGAIRRVATFESGDLEFSRGILQRPGHGNRISWQVVLKLSDADLAHDPRNRDDIGYGYSIMTADQFDILAEGPLSGSLQISGRLMLPDGQLAARYRQVLTVRRASPVIEVEIHFDPEFLPSDHAWDNYFGCRFIWRDQFANVRPGIHETLWKTEREYLQAPLCVDIRSEQSIGLTLLSAGSPFYKLRGINRIDSILIPKNESQRTFRFGLGIDLKNPIQSAIEFLSPEPKIYPHRARPRKSFSQLIKMDPTEGTILPVSLNPIYNNNELAGLNLLLLETGNRKSSVQLEFPKTITTVERTNYTSPVPEDKSLEKDAQPETKAKDKPWSIDDSTLSLELKRNQLLSIRVLFER